MNRAPPDGPSEQVRKCYLRTMGDRKYIRPLILLATILVPCACWALEPGQVAISLGVGNASCGQWTQSRRETTDDQWLAYMSWVQGFLAAYYETHDVTRGIDANGLVGWIDNFCQRHPLENIAFAAQQLISELKSRGRYGARRH